METVQPSGPSHDTKSTSTRKGKHKTKSGCRICKSRKIKCDEQRPGCLRCHTAGRVCSGYGIWDAPVMQRMRKQNLTESKPPRTLSLLSPRLSNGHVSDEADLLPWFQDCLRFKIAGAGASEFWMKLLPQAYAQEPAVFHATMAFSAAHRVITQDKRQCAGHHTTRLGNQERCVLTHYTKAIQHLKTRCRLSDRFSLRVAAIACILFVSLEFLQGHHQTASAHLRNGHKLLRELHHYDAHTESFALAPCQHFTDDWVEDCIGDTICGFAARTSLLNNASVLASENNNQSLVRRYVTLGFSSLHRARTCLDFLIQDIIKLKNLYRQVISHHQLHKITSLEYEQQRILTSLEAWNAQFSIMQQKWFSAKPSREQASGTILYNHFLMTRIMASTSLTLDDDPIFDTYIHDFTTIVHTFLKIHKLSTIYPLLNDRKHKVEASKTTYLADMGWIPPLFFVATKCRHHSVRTQAIRVLQKSDHQEGIWVTHIATAVAARVMMLEETGSACLGTNGNDLDAIDEDIAIPSREHRFENLEVILPDHADGYVILRCWRQGHMLEQLYNAESRLWI